MSPSSPEEFRNSAVGQGDSANRDRTAPLNAILSPSSHFARSARACGSVKLAASLPQDSLRRASSSILIGGVPSKWEISLTNQSNSVDAASPAQPSSLAA